MIQKLKDWFWPLVALVAVGWSLRILYVKLYAEVASDPMQAASLAATGFVGSLGIIAAEIWERIAAIPPSAYVFAGLCTLIAYAALAWYDRIALLHLGRHGISWLYISVCSFVTYAIGHNIGASVLSGGMVRYRAYSAKGLTAGEVAVLVALTSFTFAYGTIFLASLVLFYEPEIVSPLMRTFSSAHADAPVWIVYLIATTMLAFCVLYLAGSLLKLKPLTIRSFRLEYPAPGIVLRQLLAAPLEIIGAAGIIYFALPEAGNPGFMIVLGAFLLSFSAGLIFQVPGGIGVMEAVFLAIFAGVGSDMPKTDVFAALLVWRLFYLIIPLVISLPVVLAFERSQLGKATRDLKVPDEFRKH